jgi:hypothetical protein
MWRLSSNCMLLAAVMLGGCSDIYYDRREGVSLSGGDAIASNKITMMADPWPPKSNNNNIAFDGDRSVAAVQRYRTGCVTVPIAPTTSTNAPPGPPTGGRSTTQSQAQSSAGGSSVTKDTTVAATVPQGNC